VLVRSPSSSSVIDQTHCGIRSLCITVTNVVQDNGLLAKCDYGFMISCIAKGWKNNIPQCILGKRLDFLVKIFNIYTTVFHGEY